ncbi:MAG: serine hydrolase, partial [Flavobacteriaceae bacterium]
NNKWMGKTLFSVLMVMGVLCHGQQPIHNFQNRNGAIDDYVEHLMERQGIPGVALAIIKDDSIRYEKNVGWANLEHQVPISDHSIFRLYSLTKPIVSVGIFQLIEEGKVHLDDVVSKYVFDVPDSWGNIQVKHLLSHSSGLPDMAPLPDFRELSEQEVKDKIFGQDIGFEPGAKYGYNQTGFWLLQKIIEKVTGETLSEFILKNQFAFGKHTFFSSDSRDIVLNRVTPYFPFEKGTLMIDHSYLQGNYAHAKNGLNITMGEFIQWDQRLNGHRLLNTASMDAMWELFPYALSRKKFAYGWDQHNVNGHISYGFTGSLCTAYRVFPKQGLRIIFLSNGLSNWYNLDNSINHIASLVDPDMVDVNNLAFETLLRASFERNDSGFETEYQKTRAHPHFGDNDFEMHLNDVGYFWLLSLKDPEKAVQVFELNAREFPNSWNVFDSLAEAFEKSGDSKKAIHNYERAMALNRDAAYRTRTKLKIEGLKE